MDKIDHRKHYILIMDTETANTLTRADGSLDMTSVFIYDMGWQVTDRHGNIYEEKSYIVKDIFYQETQLMQSAYYAKKIPQYLMEIAEGKRIVATFYEIRKDFLDTLIKYDTKTICAHNARFDYNASNTTQRWLTKSKYRYFFPYGVEVWDTMKGAKAVIKDMPTYRKFCEENGYMTKHKTPRPRLTAEILYRFISKDCDFMESHTGLEDVNIERQILAYCFKRKAKLADFVLYGAVS
jgi:hypothetical protein